MTDETSVDPYGGKYCKDCKHAEFINGFTANCNRHRVVFSAVPGQADANHGEVRHG